MLKYYFWKALERIVAHNNFKTILARHHPERLPPALNCRLKSACTTVQHRTFSTHDETTKPVFITARFRSGSTLLWNIFRNTNGITSYYEPFNEGITFDANTTHCVDTSHAGVTDYWSEYQKCQDAKNLFSRTWAFKELLMDETSYNPEMKKYLQALICFDKSTRPVLQFNRIDFRLPWITANFPNATVVHLYRNPRNLWMSVSSKSARIPLTTSGHDFGNYNLFYTKEWLTDLYPTFGFLDPTQSKHPYYYHYCLWKLSLIYGYAYSHIHVSYEDLTNSPETTLTKLAKMLNLLSLCEQDQLNLISPSNTNKWKKYASNDWFNDIESECDDTIDNYFSNSAQT